MGFFMSDIIAMTSALSMTSKEIAELVEKRHDNVKRTIETLAGNGVIRPPQIEVVEEINNLGFAVEREVYVFTVDRKRDTYVVVAQLSPEFTARIVDRWQELEQQTRVQAQPAPLPQIELQEREAALCERLYDFSERCEDPVLRVMLLDRAKNTLAANTPALPSPQAAFFQTYQILEDLGYSEKEIRKLGANAGKRLAAAYRNLTGSEPEKVERIIDGAARKVSAFPGSFREDAQAVLAEWLGRDEAA